MLYSYLMSQELTDLLKALSVNLGCLVIPTFAAFLLPPRAAVKRSWWISALLGVFYGLAGIISQVFPAEVGSFIRLDAKTVLASSGAFFLGAGGALPGFLLMASFRWFLGGTGAFAGVMLLVAETLAGLVLRKVYRLGEDGRANLTSLLVLSAITGLVALFSMFFLPWATAINLLPKVAFPVLLLFPLATLFHGFFSLYYQARNREFMELQTTREELKASLGTLARASAGAREGTWEWDMVTDSLVLNDQWFTMLGYEPSELSPSFATWESLVHPADIARAAMAIEASCTDPAKPYSVEFRMKTKGGDWKWILARGAIQKWDPEGRPLLMAGNHVDIDQIKKNLVRLQILIETSLDGFWIVDQDFNILEANQAYLRMGEWSLEEIKRLNVSDLEEQDSLEEIHARGQELKSGRPLRFFTCHRTKTGKLLPLEASALYLPEDGLYYVFFRDLTEIHAKEKERDELIRALRDKNQELERFVYTVSHDLKSPLITIRGFAGMMNQDLQKDRIDRLPSDLKRLDAAAEKMYALLEDLLSLSRVGRISHPEEVLDLKVLAQEAAEALAGTIELTRARLFLPEAMPQARGDRTRIREVFQNLLENALKYRSPGIPPEIHISAVQLDEDMVELRIRDNGVGIPEEYQEKIFGLFEKLDPKTPGSGVGLALVRRIVEHHGGTIRAESQGAGTGTEFIFTLPAQDSLS